MNNIFSDIRTSYCNAYGDDSVVGCDAVSLVDRRWAYSKYWGARLNQCCGIKCQETDIFNKCPARTDYNCPSPCPQVPVRLIFYETVIMPLLQGF